MTFGIGLATAIGAGLSFIGGLFSNKTNKNVAQQNIEFQKDANAQNIAFQKEENEITRAREDTAVQRAAEDMTAAGLSKTLAAGNPASAAALTAPQTQAPNYSFKYESALQKMNIAQLLQSMAEKEKQLDMAEKKNDAEVDLIKAQAYGQNVTNEGLRDRLTNENVLTMAKTEETNTMIEYYKVQTKVEEIIGKYKAESLEADIAKVYQDIAQSKKSMELTDAQIEKIYYESLNIAQDTLYKELSGKKTQKEIDLLAENIVKAQLDALALKHDINYAQRYNYPVGTAPGGLLGSGLAVGYSLGDRYKEDISSDNPSGLSKFIFNFTHPIWKWKF